MNYIHKDSILDLSQDSDTRLQVKEKFVFQNRLVQKIYKNHKSKIIGLSPQLWWKQGSISAVLLWILGDFSGQLFYNTLHLEDSLALYETAEPK